MNGIYKLIDILKPLIYRGVTQIGDFIECAEFFEHFGANNRREYFAPTGFQLVHNLLDCILEGKKTGGPFFKRLGDAGSEFAPVERFMCSITLHHTEVRAFDLLISSEAIFTLQTFAAAADARSIPRLTGIDDLVITRPALGATHSVKRLITTL